MDEAFFRARYEQDATNGSRQAWKEYLDWVRAFYEGRRFPPVPGWSARQEDILRRAPPERHATLRPLLDEVGREIAAEWSKDNAVRRISTADLKAWGDRLSGAARSADELERTLRDVRQQIAQRLR